jgi:two-component system chemotaxis response regulator CheY
MRATILLLDDSRTMRDVLKVYLMGRDFEFLEAERAERALSLMRLVPVNLVFADLKMPVMDGLAFLQHLRGSDLPALRQVPVIMVTGDKNEEWQQRALSAGATAFLQKPLDSERVGDLVDRFLPRK